MNGTPTDIQAPALEAGGSTRKRGAESAGNREVRDRAVFGVCSLYAPAEGLGGRGRDTGRQRDAGA